MSSNLAYAEPYVSGQETILDNDKFLTRYAFMAGPPIDVSRRIGSQFVGDWRDDTIPNMTLIKLPDARSLGPFEQPAQIIHGDSAGSEGSPLASIPAPVSSTPNSLQRNQGSRLTRFVNVPKMCAYMLMRENEKRGMCLFEHIKGENWDEVKKIYGLIFPPDRTIWQHDFKFDLERTVLGQTVRGPFLDDVRGYLKQGGLAAERLKEMGQPGKRSVPAETLKAAVAMVKEMRLATERAHSYYLVRLNASERDILRFRDGKPGKSDYDQVDERFIGGILPMDILALAHLGRAPIDARAAVAQSESDTKANEAMLKGFEMIAGKINQPSITIEDVQKLLAERDAHWRAELEKLGAPKEVLNAPQAE